MSEAPERIWVAPDDMGPGEPLNWQRPWAELEPWGPDGETSYIRADLHDALKADNERLREALDGASEKGRGYTLKKIREDLRSCGFSGRDAELVVTYLLNSGLIHIGPGMMASAALAQEATD